MKNRNNSQSGGLIINILIIIAVLIAVKYFFNFDIITYLKSPGPQQIIQTFWAEIKEVYSWIHQTILNLSGK